MNALSRRVLIVGDGSGRFLAACARGLPHAQILCVEASAAMLDQARAAWWVAGGVAERVEFQKAILPQWQPPEAAFDLVVTHFFLACFPEAMLAPDAALEQQGFRLQRRKIFDWGLLHSEVWMRP